MALGPLLVEVERIRRKLTLAESHPDVEETLEELLTSATEETMADIRTDLARATVSDIFFIKNVLEFGEPRATRNDLRVTASLSGGRASTVNLKLTRGFVDSTVTVVVRAASSEDGLTDPARYTDLRTGGVDFVTVDYERGMVRIHDFILRNSYVIVSYTAGLTDDDGCPPLFQNVPEWVVQVTLYGAQIEALTNPLIVGTDAAILREGSREAREVEALRRKRSKVILRHVRYGPMSQKPIHSTLTLL